MGRTTTRVALAAVSGMVLTLHVTARADGPPNVIVIMADDIGFECFSPYGGESYETPNIQMLADEGMRVDQFFSQPVCSPSRVKLMSGQYNFRNYRKWQCLDDDDPTFATLLQDAGYRTAVIGKWQLFHPGDGACSTPAEAGFDEHCVWWYREAGSRYWDPTIRQNEELLETEPTDYGPDIFRDYALDFITRHREQPFLLYYPSVLPHAPFDEPPGYDGDGTQESLFGAMTEYLDAIIGDIVAHLDALGLRKDTVIMFTSDNGSPPGIDSMWNGIEVSGGKTRPDDFGTRVPMIVDWRGKIPAGHVARGPLTLADVLPTIMDVTDTPMLEDVPCDGMSFLPQMLGDGDGPREWAYMYNDPMFHGSVRTRWVRTVRWKLYGDGRLFDIQNDMYEENPIIFSFNEDVQQARAMLTELLFEIEAPHVPFGDVNRDWEVDRFDIIQIIEHMGPCPAEGGRLACPEDLNGDGSVDIEDLMLIMSTSF